MNELKNIYTHQSIFKMLKVVSELIIDRKEQGCSDENIENLLNLEGYFVGLIQDKVTNLEAPIVFVSNDMSLSFGVESLDEILNVMKKNFS